VAYRYDQLNRLKSSQYYYHNDANLINGPDGFGMTPQYFNSYTYDQNGNILNLKRNGTGTNSAIADAMDEFTYRYVGLDNLPVADPLNVPSTPPTNYSSSPSNRLSFVEDAVNTITSTAYTDDIEQGMAAGNFVYDKLGQLISDASENIQSIEWRKGDKKMKKMIRNGSGSESELEFVYNPFGQRVLKIAKPRSGGVLSPQDQWTYTYYAYDANGQVMSVYDVKMSSTNNQAYLDEQHLYGASRLGMIKPDLLLFDNASIAYTPDNPSKNLVGQTYFEINNYLGNVNVVITDRRTLANPSPGASTWEAVVISTSDYYPFGMQMPGRSNAYGAGVDFRYAYNGMEVDGEVSGDGNSYTTEFRQYDPRLGRWKSLDPLMAKFPWMSPYVAFDNNPVFFTDPLGLEGKPVPVSDPYPILVDQAHDWEKIDAYKKSTNISKGLERLNVGGSGKIRFAHTSYTESWVVSHCTYVCRTAENYQKNEYYPKYTYTTEYTADLNTDEDYTFPENYIYMEKITNSLVIRDDYVYHKQIIERTLHYFSYEDGTYLGTKTITKTIEQKQYRDKTVWDDVHFALNPNEFYSKVDIQFKPRVVKDVELTQEMAKLIQQIIDQKKFVDGVFDERNQIQEFIQDDLESIKRNETEDAPLTFPLWKKTGN
jgi:RHS repeat-associated protein